MDKEHPLSTSIAIRSLDVKKNPFRPQEDNKEIIGLEVLYLSVIGNLMYLANCIRPNIAITINLLARYSSTPTHRHQKGIQHIFRYLRRTIGIRLFYFNKLKSQLISFVDARYLSDSYKARSQIGYAFSNNDTKISWHFIKQTIMATSSNHAEMITLHEAS